jgi:formamidopyrimidine-DNA glycosylase
LELPEIYLLSRDMSRELTGKRITELEVENVKCLNRPLDAIRDEAIGRRILGAKPRGKWVFIELEGDDNLLYNTGMGANTIYYPAGNPPGEKRHIRVGLDDGSGFTSQVWWFCYLHLVETGSLTEHRMTNQLGPTPLEDAFTPEYLGSILKNRGAVKNALLDQKRVAGIGNVYIHDPLFLAGVHPLRVANAITDEEVHRLHSSIDSILRESISMGGLAYEVNFYGVKGGYGKPQYRVAYKEGEPCPTCGTAIQKIKTGATSSYVCPHCQPR